MKRLPFTVSLEFLERASTGQRLELVTGVADEYGVLHRLADLPKLIAKNIVSDDSYYAVDFKPGFLRIGSAFTWSKTPEGFEFWRHVDNVVCIVLSEKPAKQSKMAAAKQ